MFMKMGSMKAKASGCRRRWWKISSNAVRSTPVITAMASDSATTPSRMQQWGSNRRHRFLFLLTSIRQFLRGVEGITQPLHDFSRRPGVLGEVCSLSWLQDLSGHVKCVLYPLKGQFPRVLCGRSLICAIYHNTASSDSDGRPRCDVM